jgi:hypothetical protein
MIGRAFAIIALASGALALPGADAPAGMFQRAAAQQQHAASSTSGNKQRRSTMAKDWASGKCDGVSRVDGLDGQTDAQIAQTLGEPQRKETFRLGDRPDEFHITLQNHYPLRNAANRDVQIQEWTWTEGKCRLTLWLHQKGGGWVALENIRYATDADF